MLVVRSCRGDRRRRLTLLVAAELTIQIVNLLAFLLPNASLIASACYRWQSVILGIAPIVRWSCWNTVSILLHPLPDLWLCMLSRRMQAAHFLGEACYALPLFRNIGPVANLAGLRGRFYAYLHLQACS